MNTKSLPFAFLIVAASCTAGAISMYVVAGRAGSETPAEADVKSAFATYERAEARSTREVGDPSALTEPMRARVGTVHKWEPSPILDANLRDNADAGTFVPSERTAAAKGERQTARVSNDGTEDVHVDRERLIGRRASSSRARTIVAQRITATTMGAQIPALDTVASPENSTRPKKESAADFTESMESAEMPPIAPIAASVSEARVENNRRTWRRGGFTPEQELHRAQVGWHNFSAEIFELATSEAQADGQ